MATGVFNPSDLIDTTYIRQLLGAFQMLQSYGIDVYQFLDVGQTQQQHTEKEKICTNEHSSLNPEPRVAVNESGATVLVGERVREKSQREGTDHATGWGGIPRRH